MTKELLKQIEDCLPKEKPLIRIINETNLNEFFKQQGYNQALQDSKQSIPKMMEIIKEEFEKMKVTAYPEDEIGSIKINYWNHALDKVISLLSYPNQNK